MQTIPTQGASDDEWDEYARQGCEFLKPHLAEFLTARFSYKPRYVGQTLWRSGSTVSAFTRKYDLYFRVFVRPQDFWPRECIILARLMLKEQRAGHGRGLLEVLVNLAHSSGINFLPSNAPMTKPSQSESGWALIPTKMGGTGSDQSLTTLERIEIIRARRKSRGNNWAFL